MASWKLEMDIAETYMYTTYEHVRFVHSSTMPSSSAYAFPDSDDPRCTGRVGWKVVECM